MTSHEFTGRHQKKKSTIASTGKERIMKTQFKFAAIAIMSAATLLATGPSAKGQTAGTEKNPWYIQLDGGPAVASAPGSESEWGGNLGLLGGYEINTWLAVELETGFNYFPFGYGATGGTMFQTQGGSINTLNGGGTGGETWQVPLMANAIVRYQNKSRWTPYIGAGLGAVWWHYDSTGIYVQNNQSIVYRHAEGDDYYFAFQGKAGINFRMTEHWSLNLQYQCLAIDYAPQEDAPTLVYTQGVNLGVRVSF